MKPVWKWVIGIIIALVIIAVGVGAVFAVRAYVPMHRVVVQAQPGLPPNGFDGHGFDGRGFGPGFGMRGYGMPYGMMGRGMNPIGGLFSALFGLGLLTLLVLGILWLIRSLRTPKQAVVMDSCKNCGQPVQAGWKNCPYCGKKL